MGLKRKMEGFYEIMLCEAGTEADLEKLGYVAEPKFDGTPCVAERTSDNGLILHGRKGLTYTEILPDIISPLKQIRAFFRIIGELVYFNEKGEMIFSGSQKRCQISNSEKVEGYTKAYPLIYYIFDITMLNGENLENIPYYKRREILEHFIGLQKALYGLENIRITPMTTENRKMYKWAVEKGWEGVILKKLLGLYHSGERTFDMLKVKCRDHTIFVLPNNAILEEKKCH